MQPHSHHLTLKNNTSESLTFLFSFILAKFLLIFKYFPFPSKQHKPLDNLLCKLEQFFLYPKQSIPQLKI